MDPENILKTVPLGDLIDAYTKIMRKREINKEYMNDYNKRTKKYEIANAKARAAKFGMEVEEYLANKPKRGRPRKVAEPVPA